MAEQNENKWYRPDIVKDLVQKIGTGLVIAAVGIGGASLIRGCNEIERKQAPDYYRRINYPYYLSKRVDLAQRIINSNPKIDPNQLEKYLDKAIPQVK